MAAKLAVAIMVALGGLAYTGDSWMFFHAETVTKYGCKVQQVNLQLSGDRRTTSVWDASAFAQHSDGTDWGMTLGQYPATVAGRHHALKDCGHWQDKAEKLVKTTQAQK